MTFRRVLGTAIVAATLSSLAIAAPAFAEQGDAPKAPPTAAQQDAARQRFERGVKLYDEGDFKLALIEFSRAYESAPNYRLLYNIGHVQMQLGNYAKALRALKQYLQEGGDGVPPERKTEVERDIGSIRPRTATLTVRVSVADAQIELDQDALGRSPSPPQTVDGGEHRVRVTKPGFLPYEQTVVLAAGDVSDVNVSLVPLAQQTTPTRERPARPEVWISWTATAVLAVAAGVTGGLALKDNGDLKNLRDTAGSSQTERQNTANQANSFAIATDVLGVAAVLAGTAAVYFTLRKPAPVRMGLGPGSVLVRGEF